MTTTPSTTATLPSGVDLGGALGADEHPGRPATVVTFLDTSLLAIGLVATGGRVVSHRTSR